MSEQLTTMTQNFEESTIAMNAAGAHRQRTEQGGTHISNSTITTTNIQNNQTINNGDVNNIQVNIHVCPKGEENLNFIKDMTYPKLCEMLDCRCSPSTHIKMFQLIRCNEDYPENQNLLLTSRDSKKVHWFSKDGWRVGDFDEQIHGRIADDTLLLVGKVPQNFRDPEFYGSHLHEVLLNCGNKKNPLMKAIVEGIRGPLHEATMSLAAKYNPAPEETTSSEDTSNIASGSPSDTVTDRELMIIREKRLLAEAEIELEKMRLQREGVSSASEACGSNG